MQIKIAENIRNLRKERALTQEQLAEALCVTVGAVYKWESGMSMPEVRMLVEIADFFEISVDALLGYEQQQDSVSRRVDRIASCITRKDFAEAVTEVEKALQKYPNHFEIVHSGAIMYQLKFMEDRAQDTLKRSNELFQRAIPLLYQNKNTKISEVSILNNIAQNFMMVGDTERALELFRENNVCNINSATIGFLYAEKLRKPKEAEVYLFEAYIDILRLVFSTMTGLVSMYGQLQDATASKAALWACQFLDSIKEGDGIAFTDRLKAVFLALYAARKAEEGSPEEAVEYLKKSFLLAKQFDEAPVYQLKGIKFVREEYEELRFFDGLGNTASEAVENQLFQKKQLSQGEKYIGKIWEDLKNGKINL